MTASARAGNRPAERALRALALAVAVACLAVSGPAAAKPTDGDPETRATMDRIFESIRFLLPLSLDDERFREPARRGEILASLNALAENGARLESHGASRDASFGFLSRSLARDTREIRDRYAEGRFDEARFLLHQVTDDCVACHSRLPSHRRFPLGERFVDSEAIAALPLDERARLEMATRQFDKALETHEQLFASGSESPATLDLQGHFDDYLELCIRVQQDYQRPIPVFERFLARDDLSSSLRANLKSWVGALVELQKSPPKGSPLEQAQALIGTAEKRSRYPNDRRALVLYVAASSVLNQYVTSAGKPTPDVGEAYYLLGVIESRIGRSFWLSQTEYFLETAIRLNPGQPYAQDAYTLLEEFVVAGYTGSSGVNVPDDVQQRLDELRQLIEQS